MSTSRFQHIEQRPPPESQRESPDPQVLYEPFRPLSVFLCACKVEDDLVGQLGTQTASPASETEEGFCEFREKPISVEVPNFSLALQVEPRLYFRPGQGWVVLAFLVEPSSSDGRLSFIQLLALNSHFRFCQGEPERQNTPQRGRLREFRLADGRWPCQLYEERVCERWLEGYETHPDLKKAVTLSIACFDREPTDSELYLFGTIGHEDEEVEPAWAYRIVHQQAYDRWRHLGQRFLVHSYSLVCACWLTSSSGLAVQDLNKLRDRFLGPYLQMGVRIALQRAGLLEFRERLREEPRRLGELRRLHERWVRFRRELGVRWTAEGTQRAQLEHLWRRVSGLDAHAEEIDRRFEQTVDFFEAEATDRLNRVMKWLQILFVGFAAGGITAELLTPLPIGEKLLWTLGLTAAGLGVGGLLVWVGERRR